MWYQLRFLARFQFISVRPISREIYFSQDIFLFVSWLKDKWLFQSYKVIVQNYRPLSYCSISKLRDRGRHRLRVYKYKNVCAHKIIITIWKSSLLGLHLVPILKPTTMAWKASSCSFIHSIFWSRKCRLKRKKIPKRKDS